MFRNTYICHSQCGQNVTANHNISELNNLKRSLQLCTDGEASQVIGLTTTGQNRNAAVVNSLYQLFQAISKVSKPRLCLVSQYYNNNYTPKMLDNQL